MTRKEKELEAIKAWTEYSENNSDIEEMESKRHYPFPDSLD